MTEKAVEKTGNINVVGKQQEDETPENFKERMKQLFWNKQGATAAVGVTAAGWQFGLLPITAQIGGFLGIGGITKVVGYSIMMTGSGWLVIVGGAAFLVGFGGIVANATIAKVERRVVAMFTNFKDDLEKQLNNFKDGVNERLDNVDEFIDWSKEKINEIGKTTAAIAGYGPTLLAIQQNQQDAITKADISELIDLQMNKRYGHLLVANQQPDNQANQNQKKSKKKTA
jgi:hypothetical protein